MSRETQYGKGVVEIFDWGQERDKKVGRESERQSERGRKKEKEKKK